MLYINNNTEIISIPKHIESTLEAHTLHLVNNLANGIDFIIPLEIVAQNDYYYILKINNQNIPTGEYTYYLKSDNTTLESGLLVYGDYIKDVKEYEKTKQDTIYER